MVGPVFINGFERIVHSLYQWYLRYLKEGLEPKMTLNKAEDRPKPSAARSKRKRALNISLQKGGNPGYARHEESRSPPLTMRAWSRAFD